MEYFKRINVKKILLYFALYTRLARRPASIKDIIIALHKNSFDVTFYALLILFSKISSQY